MSVHDSDPIGLHGRVVAGATTPVPYVPAPGDEVSIMLHGRVEWVDGRGGTVTVQVRGPHNELRMINLPLGEAARYEQVIPAGWPPKPGGPGVWIGTSIIDSGEPPLICKAVQPRHPDNICDLQHVGSGMRFEIPSADVLPPGDTHWWRYEDTPLDEDGPANKEGNSE